MGRKGKGIGPQSSGQKAYWAGTKGGKLGPFVRHVRRGVADWGPDMIRRLAGVKFSAGSGLGKPAGPSLIRAVRRKLKGVAGMSDSQIHDAATRNAARRRQGW